MAVEAKICGLVRPEDAAFAAEHGASYLGVIFAGGPRLVTASQARGVVVAGGGVPVLGVFAGQTADEILALRDAAGLSGAQLHGGALDAAAIARLRREGMLVWRTVHLATADDLARLGEAGAVDTVDAVLVEPRVAGALGGTGVALAADLAVRARERLAGRRMVLAGGLTPGTLAERLALVRPDVADVSSGVEVAPGVKSPVLLADFLEVARGWTADA